MGRHRGRHERGYGIRHLGPAAVRAAARAAARLTRRWQRIHRLATADPALTGYLVLALTATLAYPVVLQVARWATVGLDSAWIVRGPGVLLAAAAVLVPVLLAALVVFTVLPLVVGTAAAVRASRLVRQRRRARAKLTRTRCD